MGVGFRKCTDEDIEQIVAIGKETYFDTFAAMNTPENMTEYLQTAFNKEKIASELRNENSMFFFLYLNGNLAGYLKVTEKDAQTDLREENGIEIERIYVKKKFQGMGLGRKLVAKGKGIAEQRKKTFMWVGVWERNKKAKEFYKHMGFNKTGTHDFYMGQERQTDYIMRKETAINGI